MKNSSIPCNVIIDMLPLYKEEICSDETKELLEEHLRSCENCRQLYEELSLPAPKNETAPSEAETFKKVGKKLKRSRFTKIMSALMCICLVLFGAVNGAWYFLKYRPMKKMCVGMRRIDNSTPTAKFSPTYVDDDDDYVYAVILPDYLDFSVGYMVISPKGSDEMLRSNDTKQPVLMISYSMFGKTDLSVHRKSIPILMGDNVIYTTFEVNNGLTDLFNQYFTSKHILETENMFKSHAEELEAMKKAAQKKWGEYL
ncbi:zf-HC2 domain-containing protein [Ruminococcus sp.]|jgi:hypothetical protein|uniref:zf-HC2 domain-containing protein n=1 Tax=Ruminococcus sp. TaxID=41978 RepID=UPI0025D01477|nr:zf-HC2 domain-containing protein [Ruminococcus sp.]